MRTSEAGRAVGQTERRIDRIEQTDERAQANAEARVDDALGVSETQRDIRSTERSLENLENVIN